MKSTLYGYSMLVLLPLTSLLTMARAEDTFNQEEPSLPPTGEFQGPDSGHIVPIPEGNGPQVNQDRVVDFEYCYGALARNDINGNDRLDSAEFYTFAQDFGGATECLGQMEQIPLELLVVWNTLSCECKHRGGADDCCRGSAANVPITGNDFFDLTDADPAPILSEQNYLEQVCTLTDQAIVTHCAPPPPPIIPGPPPAQILRGPAPSDTKTGMIVGFTILALFVLVPWRRRWIFCAGGKDEESDDESSDDESEDAGGMRHVVTEEGGEYDDGGAGAGDIEEGAAGEPDDDAMQLRAVGEEEDGQFGGTSYGRTVEMPEYEEEGDPRRAVYEQFDLPDAPEVPIVLAPIPGKSKEEEDEPYDLEHYVPDGGIIEYEREGEWAYDADGGWTPEERPDKDPSEWEHGKYERAEAPEPEVVDDRRQRVLHAYGGGEIFDRLEQDVSETVSGTPDDMFDWVIQSTLNTLDQKAEDLQGSVHSGSDTTSSSDREK